MISDHLKKNHEKVLTLHGVEHDLDPLEEKNHEGNIIFMNMYINITLCWHVDDYQVLCIVVGLIFVYIP